MSEVKKLFMPNYSLSDVFLWNRSQFCHNNHFCQGVGEKDTCPILLYVKNRYKLHFIEKIVRDVKKLFMPNCSLCDAILWNRSQFCHNAHFCQGVGEKDTCPILPYLKNWYKSHFIDKIVRDVKILVMPSCSYCDAILWNRSQLSKVNNENKQTTGLEKTGWECGSECCCECCARY